MTPWFCFIIFRSIAQPNFKYCYNKLPKNHITEKLVDFMANLCRFSSHLFTIIIGGNLEPALLQ